MEKNAETNKMRIRIVSGAVVFDVLWDVLSEPKQWKAFNPGTTNRVTIDVMVVLFVSTL